MTVADAACVIVAGGKARRLEHKVKALIEIDGRTILDRTLEVMTSRFAALAIAANDPVPYEDRGLPILPDQAPDQGPLAGIQAALGWSRQPYVMVVPCDMPYIDGAVIDLLLSRRGPAIDAVVPCIGPMPEPLLALYSVRCLPAVERRLAAGRYKASGLITDEGLRICRVGEAELRAIDPTLRFLTNVNSEADLARLL